MNNIELINFLVSNNVDFNLYVRRDEIDTIVEMWQDRATIITAPDIPQMVDCLDLPVIVVDNSDSADVNQKDIISKLVRLTANHPKSVIWMTTNDDFDTLPEDQLRDNLNHLFFPITSIYD